MYRHLLRLCLVTNLKKTPFHLYRSFILKAIQGGITSVQLREKTQSLDEFRHLAFQFKSVLRPFKIPLIINDHVDIAKEVDAEGVHLGQSDISPLEARKIMGAKKIIGWSVETLEELEQANRLQCINYIGASAVFPSKTKPDCRTIWGISGLQTLVARSKHPVMAIGGINLTNIGHVMQSGACGAAVIGAIHDYPDAKKAATDLIMEMEQSLQNKERVCLRR